MPLRIVDIREVTKPISSPIRNAYIDFSKMTTSLVAVVTNVVRDGRPVVGYVGVSNLGLGFGWTIMERIVAMQMDRSPPPRAHTHTHKHTDTLARLHMRTHKHALARQRVVSCLTRWSGR